MNQLYVGMGQKADRISELTACALQAPHKTNRNDTQLIRDLFSLY